MLTQGMKHNIASIFRFPSAQEVLDSVESVRRAYASGEVTKADIDRFLFGLQKLLPTALEFVSDIESTGGVFVDEDAIWRLNADPEWTDLAVTYLHMCRATSTQPVIEDQDEDAPVCPGCKTVLILTERQTCQWCDKGEL